MEATGRSCVPCPGRDQRCPRLPRVPRRAMPNPPARRYHTWTCPLGVRRTRGRAFFQAPPEGKAKPCKLHEQSGSILPGDSAELTKQVPWPWLGGSWSLGGCQCNALRCTRVSRNGPRCLRPWLDMAWGVFRLPGSGTLAEGRHHLVSRRGGRSPDRAGIQPRATSRNPERACRDSSTAG
jgi:hypothetical protein